MTSGNEIFVIIFCGLAFSAGVFTSQATAGETSSLHEGEKLYTHYCSPCHGMDGDGKGFNARNLDPRPANHADAEFMAKRTDKDLTDAISGGGRFVGKSSLMPPWGNTFRKAQIKDIVWYLRKVCKCEGR
jgi:mono/diheme cytochrome c family protein